MKNFFTAESRAAAAPQLVRRALRLRDSGRAEQAEPLLRAGVVANPNHPQLWQTLGLVYRALEDSASALDAFGRAARLAPADPKIAHGLARVTMESGLPAFALYERARQLAPSDGDLLLGRVAAQVAEGQLHQAISDLDIILQGNPTWLAGHRLLADLRWTAGDQEGFTAGLERALAQHSADLTLWHTLLAVLFDAGLFARADGVVAQARRGAGPDPSLDLAEAVCASETGDWNRADRLFAALQPFVHVAGAVRYVRHLLRTGRAEEAAAAAEPLVETKEANRAWPYLALAWRLTGDERWRWLMEDPRLVGVYDLSAEVELGALADRLRIIHRGNSHPLGQSVRGGTQTDGPLFARIEPEIRGLRAAIVRAVDRHVAAMQPVDPSHPTLRHGPAPVRFAGSWSVRLTGAGFHTNHLHQEGWLSSVFYVSVPGADELGPAPAGWLSLGEPQAELGLDLAPIRQIEPKAGRLVLFPSILWHGTKPFTAGERLTVAFDVAPPVGS